MTTSQNTVIVALAEIAGKLEPFTHDDQVQGKGDAGYSFTSVDAIQDTTRPLLAAAGILLHPSSVTVVSNDEVVRDRGNYTQYQHRVVALVEWVFTNGTDLLAVQVLAEAMDSSDKASMKMMTASRKRAIMDALYISTKDDPDRHRPGDDGGPVYQQSRRPSGQQTSGGRGPRPVSDAQLRFLTGLLRKGREELGERATDVLRDAITSSAIREDERRMVYDAVIQSEFATDPEVLRSLPGPAVSKLIDVLKGSGDDGGGGYDG